MSIKFSFDGGFIMPSSGRCSYGSIIFIQFIQFIMVFVDNSLGKEG